jgi:predicted esterase
MGLDRRRVWRVIRIVWIAFGLLVPVVLLLGLEAAYLPPDTLVSDARVEIVLGRETFDFRPRPDDPARTGLLFFPGALVEPEAYAPMARAIAGHGHYVVIIRLPFRLAPTMAYKQLVFETALETMASSPRKWAVGGHSRGGKIAAEFTAAYPDRVAGLALIATTHPRDVNISGLRPCVPVWRILGTRDPIASIRGARENAAMVPPHTRYLEIEGANHRQFGYYRYQLFDRRATISREEQHRRMIEGILTVLRPASQAGGASGGCAP